ncbi:hypothetical protein D3P08_00690 [Paenibacillus nanensis]|uniref:Uncharacterized protein n=1 Tax=Paenibacillus nanensis TaxID=393251 RepID=A0A3A1VGV6_9BACL|nr:hypothetical protein [Paenibacillus nanensis]RIX60138.1 hypothetical protein D3P08_00690 [Paenibacillus nanensis]
MNELEKQLKPLYGRKVEVRIEDASGEGPVAPPRVFELVRVKLENSSGGTGLICDLSVTQHVTIPVFSDGSTKFISEGPDSPRLISEDRGAQLVYSLVWMP